MADRQLQAAIFASFQTCRGGGGGGGGGGGSGLMPSGGRMGAVGAAHLAARQQRQSRLQREGIIAAPGAVPPGRPPKTPSSRSIAAAKPPPAASKAPGQQTLALPAPKSLPPSTAGSGVSGMPTDLPPDANRVLSRRCASKGGSELAVPLGEGWMQRAGRGRFESVDEPAAKGPCMQLESAESNMFLLTYDQNPDSQCVVHRTPRSNPSHIGGPQARDDACSRAPPDAHDEGCFRHAPRSAAGTSRSSATHVSSRHRTRARHPTSPSLSTGVDHAPRSRSRASVRSG